MGYPILEFYIVTLVPAAAILMLILALRIRNARNKDAEVVLIWEPDNHSHPVVPSAEDTAKWRKSYFG